VVHVHGTSGFEEADVRCRAAQIERALGLAGARTILLGDFNTDPTRLRGGDASADALAAGAARAQLGFHTDVGADAPPTYAGLVSIDHVLSDFAAGDCVSRSVTEMVYFDHRPQVCGLASR
jgi:endonuclease/exonuclease/phosphatase family metal-dependent hydrolase